MDLNSGTEFEQSILFVDSKSLVYISEMHLNNFEVDVVFFYCRLFIDKS